MEVTQVIFTQTEKSVKFHTGLLSVTMFHLLMQMLLCIWNPPSKIRLRLVQQLIGVNEVVAGLANTGSIAPRSRAPSATVSSIFHSSFDVLVVNMRTFIMSTSSQSTTFLQNRPFDNARRITDRTETFTLVPASITARSQTFSSYELTHLRH